MERAAILAAGGDFQAIMAWIVDHDGTAEVEAPKAAKGGCTAAGSVSARPSARRPPPVGSSPRAPWAEVPPRSSGGHVRALGTM